MSVSAARKACKASKGIKFDPAVKAKESAHPKKRKKNDAYGADDELATKNQLEELEDMPHDDFMYVSLHVGTRRFSTSISFDNPSGEVLDLVRQMVAVYADLIQNFEPAEESDEEAHEAAESYRETHEGTTVKKA